MVIADRDKPIIVDFFATWCGPCVMLSKELEKVSWARPAPVGAPRGAGLYPASPAIRVGDAGERGQPAAAPRLPGSLARRLARPAHAPQGQRAATSCVRDRCPTAAGPPTPPAHRRWPTALTCPRR